MFLMRGRILTINVISDKSAQVVLKKQVNGKKTAVAINVWGFWKEKVDNMKLNPNDKIEGVVYAKSSLWKGKWYTDLYFKGIDKVDETPKVKKDDINMPIFDITEEINNPDGYYDDDGNFIF
jgi:hypothetical protein